MRQNTSAIVTAPILALSIACSLATVHCQAPGADGSEVGESALESGAGTGAVCDGAERLFDGLVTNRLVHDGARFYWRGAGNDLLSINLDGSDRRTVLRSYRGDAVAVDDDYVYVVNHAKDGAIERVAKGGNAEPETLYADAAASTDGSAGNVTIIDGQLVFRSFVSGRRELRIAPKTGEAAGGTMRVLAPSCYAYFADAAGAYCSVTAEVEQKLDWVALDGSGRRTVDPSMELHRGASDERYVYWIGYSWPDEMFAAVVLNRALRSGGPTETLATSEKNALGATTSDISMDATHLFFGAWGRGDEGGDNWNIARVSKTGGEPEAVLTSRLLTRNTFVHEGFLYFNVGDPRMAGNDRGGLFRTRLSGLSGARPIVCR